MDRIRYLILQFLREEITAAEQAELDSWVAEAPANRDLMQELQDPEKVTEGLAKLDSLRRREAWKRVEEHAQAVRAANGMAEVDTLLREQRVRRIGWRKYAVAAAVIGLAGIGFWWVASKRETEPKSARVATAKTNDIQAPSRTRATLTLASGQTVDLDSAGSGTIAQQGNLEIVKGKNGQLVYAPEGRLTIPGPTDLIYNTVTNPRGSQIVNLTLSDGTRVWLNAESSLRYPVAFLGKERAVEITGEAYFEVAKEAKAPFIVNVLSPADRKLRQKVVVLGTAFNVMGYDDEPAVKTSLVEGAVKVEAGESAVKLAGGQQVEVDTAGGLHRVAGADIDKAVAWRYGNFQFEGDDIGEVMRQLTRWYSVEVKYEAMPKVHYTGGISRNLNISKVLNMLALSGLHCRIDSNTVVVLP